VTETGDLRESIRDLKTSIDQLRNDLVRRDVYESDQRGVAARIAVLEKELAEQEARVNKAEERRAADRRLIMTSLVLPIVVALVLLYITSQLGGVQ
jgi:multidrug resistance efflux pump